MCSNTSTPTDGAPPAKKRSKWQDSDALYDHINMARMQHLDSRCVLLSIRQREVPYRDPTVGS